jgi:hypothetical protein
VTERIEEAFSLGDEGKEPGTVEGDPSVMDEPQSQPDLEEGKEGGNSEPEEREENAPPGVARIWIRRDFVRCLWAICPILW